MAENVNAHVDRLGRFLPFDPAHDQIYEEYQVSGDSLSLDTIAFEYVMSAARAGARAIILTGDAGHGKTHLCRRVIQELLGYSEGHSREKINSSCDGQTRLEPTEGVPFSGALRVFKDFSEFAPEIAASLVEASAEDDSVTIICANEGRLRAVLNSTAAGPACSELRDRFEASFEDGLASGDGGIHVVNLNHQSIAAGESGASLSDRALREWLSGTRWRVCGDCSSREACPIYRNRELMSERLNEFASRRKSKLRLLLATLERIGYVITIRDMLMTFAYLLTGGLSCTDVHTRLRRRTSGWQHEYAIYNLAFEAPRSLSNEQLKRLPLMQQLPKLDPGKRAIRKIDERIINEQGIFPHAEVDLQFQSPNGATAGTIDAADGIDEIIGDPRNRKQRASEASKVTRVVRALRRRAFFDGVGVESLDMLHLGFPYGQDFLKIVAGGLDQAELAKLKKRVIAGLHHIQGLNFAEATPTLHLVDPAFGRSMSGTAILACRLNPSNIQLIRLSDKWGKVDEADFHLQKSVDWLDRHVVIRITDAEGKPHDLLLDLMTFDCVLRAAAGHVPTRFYEHDIRRVASFLGRIAQAVSGNSEQINVVRDGRAQTISIDGGTIQVGPGA